MVGSYFEDAEIGIVCGAVSGGLEVIDFDRRGIFQRWKERLLEVSRDTAALIDSAVHVRTASGCDHLYFRCSSPVAGNIKLAAARVPFADINGKERRCMIETRGEGGYVVAPPSIGYTIQSGDFGRIPSLSRQAVETLHQVARSYNEVPAKRSDWATIGTSRPGDAYNADASVKTSDLLEQHGWRRLFKKGGCWHMCRPGKSGGVSATSDYEGGGVYVFTTNDPTLAEGQHSKFDVFSLLEHGGDYQAAARELGKRGYGEPPRRHEDAPRIAKAPKLIDRPTLASRIVSGGSQGLMGRPREKQYLIYSPLKDHERSGCVEPSGIIPRGKCGMLVGEGGCGKTWWTIQLAVSVASGRSFMGCDVRSPGRVLLLSAEMDQEDMDDRFRLALTAAGCEQREIREDVMSKIVRVPLQGVDVSMIDSRGLETEIVKQITDLVSQDDYSLAVIDPLSQFGGQGVETDPVVGNRIVRFLNCIAAGRNNPTVLIVHHTAKSSRGGVKTTSAAARGTSALTDGVRWQGNLEMRERVQGLPDFAVFRQTKNNDGASIVPIRLIRNEALGGALRLATREEWAEYREAMKGNE